jgi:hypothetical protein
MRRRLISELRVSGNPLSAKFENQQPEQFLFVAVACPLDSGGSEMAFNRTSYMAGVGSVFMVLSTGFAGGYFMANPTHNDPPNRLQRVASAQDEKPVAQATPSAKPEMVAAAAVAPAPVAAQPSAPAAAPVSTEPAAQPAAIPVDAKIPEPARGANAQPTVGQASAGKASQINADKINADKVNIERPSAEKANPDKARTADAKGADKRRTEMRKFAEQQRRQRELEIATIAVRRIIHDRDAPDRDAPVLIENDQPDAPASDTPRFGLFR